MAKTAAMFVLALLIVTAVANAARPLPERLAAEIEEKDAKVENDREGCEGAGEEECLARRTLNAHTDYIYTQHHNP